MLLSAFLQLDQFETVWRIKIVSFFLWGVRGVLKSFKFFYEKDYAEAKFEVVCQLSLKLWVVLSSLGATMCTFLSCFVLGFL